MGVLKKLRRNYEELRKRLDLCARSRRRVVLISYPKSGRTWVRFMLDTAGLRIRYDHAGSENRLALPFEEIASRTSDWRDWRVIFLHRDPRDTVVSCYFQASRRLKEKYAFRGSIGEFIRDPRYGIEKIARFNLHWLECAGEFRETTSVSYEGLHSATKPELARILRFITGKQASDFVLDRALTQGQFDNMRAVEMRKGNRIDESTRLGGGRDGDENSLKTRRGKVGGWMDHFDTEEIAWMEGVLERLNYWDRLGTSPGPERATAG